jgi:hypothetical protein
METMNELGELTSAPTEVHINFCMGKTQYRWILQKKSNRSTDTILAWLFS